MGNFTRRAIAFILGMVVGIVTLFGGMAGAMYWAFKNLTLSKIGAMQEDESGLSDATIEELVALVMLARSDPDSFTIQKLEEQGIDVLKLLGGLGVDFSNADQIDYDKLKDISPLLLFSSEGLNEISFSTVFALLPKGEDGKYPLFSYGARNMLRGYSLGYLLATDETTGQMRLFNELGSLKIGSLFPKTFTETYSEEKSEYIYTAENSALEKVGNLKIALITNNVKEGATFDLGYELNEGELKEIGDALLVDFLADLISGSDETAKQETKQMLSLFDGVFVKELFKFNDDGDVYEFNAEVLFAGFSIGKFMGYTQCAESETCPVHENVLECNGAWYEKCTESETCPVHGDSGCTGKENEYKEYASDTAEGLITKNLINLSIEEILMGGFEITNLVGGVYLGHSLGYKIASSEDGTTIPSEYCDKNCTVEHSEHKYYWVNDAGEFVGTLYNDFANISLESAMLGGINLEGIIEGSCLGELLGKYKKDGVWYDDSACTEKTKNESAMDKILLSIYDKNTDDFSNGTLKLEELLDGIKLGELMGYTIGENEHYCKADCAIEEEGHKHVYYWLKDGVEQNFTKFDKTLYETKVSNLVDGTLNFKTILGDLYVGELMGNTYDGTVWEKEDGSTLTLDVLNKAIYEIKVSELLNGGVEFKTKLGHIHVGELMGYTGSVGAWHDGTGPVSKLNSVMADVKLEEIFDGSFNLKSKVDTLTLGDVITIDEDTPKILQMLEGSKINELSQDINEMYLGEVMGYTECTESETCPVHSGGDGCTGKWHREDGSVVDGLNAKIANYTFETFASTGFETDDFTLGDVIKDDKEYGEEGIFSLLDVGEIDNDGDGTIEEGDYAEITGNGAVEKRKNIPISEVATRMKKGVTKATLEQLMKCGVLDLSSVEGKLVTIFEGESWKQLSMQGFIEAVIAKIPG